MKKIGLLLITLISAITVMAQGIVFETGSWSELLAKAKDTGKPVFVDVFTTWCGPCKMMSKEIFPMESVGKVFNESFVSYQLDAEKGEGVELAKKYEIKAYPTYLFLKPDGTVFFRFLGSMPAESFLRQAQVALNEAKDPKTISDWDLEYPQHKTDTAFLKGYMLKRDKIGISNVELLEEYMKLIPESEQKLAPMCDLLFKEYDNIKVGTLAFDYLLKNHEAIDQLNPKIVYAFLEGAIGNSVRDAARTKDESKLQACVNALSTLPASKLSITPDNIYMDYYRATGNKDKYFQQMVQLCNNQLMKITVDASTKEKVQSTAFNLNEYAWQVYQNMASKDSLTTAAKWSKRSLELAPGNYSFMDTQACLLYKLGNKKEAVAMEEKALALIEKSSADYGNYEKVLNRMKAGEKIWEK